MFPALHSRTAIQAIVKENSTHPTPAPNGTTRTTVYTNLGSNSESARVYQCLYNESSFFEAIEVNYPSLLSPIQLVPRALSASQVQEQFLRVSAHMPVRIGPMMSKKARAMARVPIIKRDFDRKTALLASPLVFQTRSNASARCPEEEPRNYTSRWLQGQHAKMRYEKCSEPFECDADTLRAEQRLIACRGEDLEVEDVLFGQAYSFSNERGWPEFLFSITDNEVLFRGDQLMPTSAIIDSSTKVLTIVLPFFTPEYGTSTILELRADFGGTIPVKAGFKVRHYHFLTGTPWMYFAVLQLVVLFNLPMLIYDGVKAFATSWNMYKMMLEKHKGLAEAGNPPPLPAFRSLFTPAVDLMSGFLMIGYVVWNVWIKWESADQTSRLAGDLSNIEWANASVAMDSKIDTYLSTISAYRKLISAQESCETLANFILYVNLLRMIQCTTLHPRLAILTETLVTVLEDLFHAFLLFGMLMLLMASMANWRFGDSRDEFGSLGHCLGTQVQMMLGGDFPLDWQQDPEITVWTSESLPLR